MPYITVKEDLPGIRALLAFSPETADPLGGLATALLRDTEGLTPAERELIAAHVSYQNDCFYCQTSHGAIASHYLGGASELVEKVKTDFNSAPVSAKLKALLSIAGKVQQSGKSVTQTDIDQARSAGASDKDIHDAVLIAAAFCLFNRYVDGLGTTAPTDPASYDARAKQVAEKGYGNHIFSAPQPG